MKERPILFSAPMVKALLDGCKTQTRRAVKPQPPAWANEPKGVSGPWATFHGDHPGGKCGHPKCACSAVGPAMFTLTCPYGARGDRLWVKETFVKCNPADATFVGAHSADGLGKGTLLGADCGAQFRADWVGIDDDVRWTSALFMPRRLSRILLEITDVRVQRVEDISEEDARAEGCGPDFVATAEWAKRHGHGDAPIAEGHRARFLQRFYDINKRAGRGENPWVWALTFKVVKP